MYKEGRKIIYEKGDRLGPYNIEFIEEVEGYTKPSGQKERKAKFICPLCGNPWITRITGIKSGTIKSCRCQRDYKYKKGEKVGENGVEFSHYINDYISPSGNHAKKAVFICPECGESFNAIIQNVKRGLTKSCGCSFCISHGERKIKELLSNMDIEFETEKKFENCINPKTGCQLRFDFYLSHYNLLLEYDGKQHYVGGQGGNWDSLENNKYRDSVKNQYCKDNNIKLIRIPYWDYDKLDENYLLERIANE